MRRGDDEEARITLLYLLPLAFLGILLFRDLLGSYRTVALLPYSEFQQLLAQQKVKEVLIEGDSIRGELKEPLKEGPNKGIPQPPRRLYSEETAHEIDVALRGLVETAHGRARSILEVNRALL